MCAIASMAGSSVPHCTVQHWPVYSYPTLKLHPYATAMPDGVLCVHVGQCGIQIGTELWRNLLRAPQTCPHLVSSVAREEVMNVVCVDAEPKVSSHRLPAVLRMYYCIWVSGSELVQRNV
jgi:hypothetical protein